MIINGNALSIPLADKSVHCIVTSPPYWGLRDYGTAKWQGGDEDCKHTFGGQVGQTNTGQHETSYIGGVRPGVNANICGKCGAIRIDNQLGLERTPDEYVANMVAVFRECWRVLRDDGTLWCNLGDSYYGGKGQSSQAWSTEHQDRDTLQKSYHQISGFGETRPSDLPQNGIKPKDLVGIPWRVAFALQADGWYLRSDIIWSKPNPMPESVTDRPTKAHEYLFLLTKQERYYYDAEAVKEAANQSEMEYRNSLRAGKEYSVKDPYESNSPKHYNDTSSRNRRSVWTIPTAPYKGAHFATFPPALVEPCIKAGTSERGVCPKCGKGWKRVINNPKIPNELRNRSEYTKMSFKPTQIGGGQKLQDWRNENQSSTTGWLPSCACNAGDPCPAIVFDPFAGSGTTVKVAFDLGRVGVGLDLSLEYLDKQATKRIHNGHTGRLI